MVRDFDNIDTADGQPGDASLLLCSEVTQERDGQRSTPSIGPHVDTKGHARLVPAKGAPPLRPLHSPAERPESAGIAADCFPNHGSRAAERGPIALVVSAGCGADECGISAAERGVETADVVEVVVGEHQESHPLHAHQTKTGVERLRIRPRVDEQDAVVAAQEDRVSLADIAQCDAPVVGDGRRAQQRSRYRGTTRRR